jgi:probable rRNA maturation factor
MEHQILFDSDREEPVRYEELISTVIRAALDAEGVEVPCEIGVLFTDDDGIHQINLEQRQVDRPTDVLSFPMFEFVPGQPPTPETAELDPGSDLLPLGDMVLNLDRAQEQAEEYGHSMERELAYLTVHSMLHLLGYDHMDDGPMQKQMRGREEAILGELGITRD